jgi:predicted O-methyltransferase YrrM
MAHKTTVMTDALYEYMLSVSVREPEVLQGLRAETSKLEEAGMQIAPDQGQFMSMLIKVLGAKRTLEVGTFTGYSALVVALALPPDGKVIACDVSEEWTGIGRRYWARAGVADKIDLRIAPGAETLAKLAADSNNLNGFDFAFIDADKTIYGTYYDYIIELVRPGGVIAIDNVLWGGSVADESDQKPDTVAIRQISERIYKDARVDVTLVPIGDGLMLARKR